MKKLALAAATALALSNVAWADDWTTYGYGVRSIEAENAATRALERAREWEVARFEAEMALARAPQLTIVEYRRTLPVDDEYTVIRREEKVYREPVPRELEIARFEVWR